MGRRWSGQQKVPRGWGWGTSPRDRQGAGSWGPRQGVCEVPHPMGLTQLLNVGASETASESPGVLVSKCLFLSPTLDNKSEPREMGTQNLMLTRLSGDSHAHKASRIPRMSDKAPQDSKLRQAHQRPAFHGIPPRKRSSRTSKTRDLHQ